MKALTFDELGNFSDVIDLVELPIPTCASKHMLIKVLAAPIQPADELFLSGRYRIKPALPQVAGVEGVGIIVQAQGCDPSFTVGSKVAFRTIGAWAQYVAVPENRAYLLPKAIEATIDDYTACQFALNPLTAYALLDVAQVNESNQVLLTAGRSVVAGLMSKMARTQSVFLLVREQGKYQLLHANDNRMVAEADSIADLLQKANLVFDVIVDAVGGMSVSDLIQSLAVGGKLVSYGLLDASKIQLNLPDLLFRNMHWVGFGIDYWLANTPSSKLRAICDELWQFLLKNPSVLPVKSVHRLDEFKKAFESLQDPSRGKVVFTINHD